MFYDGCCRSTGVSSEQRGGGHATAAAGTPAPTRRTHKTQLQLVTKPLHLHNQAHQTGQCGQANKSTCQQVTIYYCVQNYSICCACTTYYIVLLSVIFCGYTLVILYGLTPHLI